MHATFCLCTCIARALPTKPAPRPSTHLQGKVLANLGALLAAGDRHNGRVAAAAGPAGQIGALIGIGVSNQLVRLIGDSLE